MWRGRAWERQRGIVRDRERQRETETGRDRDRETETETKSEAEKWGERDVERVC